MQKKYGFNRQMPNNVDFYVLSNEDIGFIANLTTGSVNVYNFSLPYPADIDLMEETIIVHAIEFIYQTAHSLRAGASQQSLNAFLSFLDKDFDPAFAGVGVDAEDEALKSKFARNIFFGQNFLNVTATASVEGTQRTVDNIEDALYIPPVPLDLATPLFIDFVNQSQTVVLATNVPTGADFTTFEMVQLVVWFTVRKLTADEKNVRNSGQRFSRLNA